MIISLPAKPKQKTVITITILFLYCLLGSINLVIPLFLTLLYLFFNLAVRRGLFKDFGNLNLFFLFLINFSAAYLIIIYGLPLYCLPFSALPIVAVLLFHEPAIPVLLNLAAAVCAAYFYNDPFRVIALFLISALTAVILVLDSRKRSTVIRCGLWIGLAQAAAVLFLDHFKAASTYNYLFFFLNGIICSIGALGVLSIFEHLFKTLTNISLLELADFNYPLLQRLIMEAPGTYHHSLVVGNLSEAAAKAVGANALLARVGAYYHDIGKLKKPEYFSENQQVAANKHSELPATMSKMIIMNHVREGVELARKHKLNPALINFIQQHHGRSLVYYFYRRALEALEDDQQVKEEGFRYPGPKPDTREAAIVLLADSVEAACRALSDPAPARVKELVHKVINNKFIDGQLDECSLTLRDMERISEVFIRILSGIYHSRINYPESPKDAQTNRQKSAKENSRQGAEDKKSNL